MTKSLRLLFHSKIEDVLLMAGLVLLTVLPRLTHLNQYLIVDEEDRWRWAKNFVSALSRGDLAATIGEVGYPGLVPIWAESLWIWLEAGRRSLLEGRWIGEPGLYLIMHEWDRPVNLFQQRLPVVLLNTGLALLVVGFVWRLFGKWVAVLSGLLIALDPFYLTDSRVNRADALITGLMTLSILALIFYDRQRRRRWLISSGIFAGLAFVTKIQAIAMLPAIGLILLFIWTRRDNVQNRKPLPYFLLPTTYSLLLWGFAAAVTWSILWPAMWVRPLDALGSVYDLATMKVGAEGADLFFFGQAHADPGPLFYPFAFVMRLTPLALLGFTFYVLRFVFQSQKSLGGVSPSTSNPTALNLRSGAILLIYIVLYTLAMIPSTHKQDRYLMPIFLAVDILAVLGWVNLWLWLKSKIKRENRSPTFYVFLPASLLAGFLLIQIITVLPHHPYYYSYFNPLLGGGQTAVRTLRIGWGEGMDQVGAYLAAKPNSRDLVVASRFTHNMLGFKGDQISLLPDGRWTQADYVVLYIQQVQRRQEPSPGFIDYFQARTPEKIVTVAGIDYAWIYPIPFTTPADPQVSVLPDQAALLGYSWEAGQSGESASLPAHQLSLRLLWENLGLPAGRQLVARLASQAVQNDWVVCQPDPAFLSQAQTAGAYVESLCSPPVENLAPGFYTVEFGLAVSNPSSPKVTSPVESFRFPQGHYALQILPDGLIQDTPEAERLAAMARQSVPAEAEWLDRIYNGQLRLVAYELDPAVPTPGETVKLRLYWQALRPIKEPLHLTVQLADSRLITLGRYDGELISPEEKRWFPGEIITVQPQFELRATLDPPLAAQVEIQVLNQVSVEWLATDSAGAPLDNKVVRFTIGPEIWPTLTDLAQSPPFQPIKATWPNGIELRGYSLAPQRAQPGETLQVTLFWQTSQPVADNYIVFIHLLDDQAQIKAQNDALPRAGAYPVLWWQPGVVIEDVHRLVLPPDLSSGVYQLVVGLYRPESGQRLLLDDGADNLALGRAEIFRAEKK